MTYSEAWENRFRDPHFVDIWDRWRIARGLWDKLRKCTPFKEGGEDMFFNPDPALISDPTNRAAAQEYISARSAYLDEIKSDKKPLTSKGHVVATLELEDCRKELASSLWATP